MGRLNKLWLMTMFLSMSSVSHCFVRLTSLKFGFLWLRRHGPKSIKAIKTFWVILHHNSSRHKRLSIQGNELRPFINLLPGLKAIKKVKALEATDRLSPTKVPCVLLNFPQLKHWLDPSQSYQELPLYSGNLFVYIKAICRISLSQR